MKLSVIIVTYNSQQTILNCLSGLTKALKDGVIEVIIVDNLSKDETLSIIDTYTEVSNLKIIKSSDNLGFAGGVNLGINNSKGEYFLLLNPDAEIDSKDLLKLVKFMDENPQSGISSPQILSEDLTPSNLALSFPSVWKGLIDVFRLSKLIPVQQRADIFKLPGLTEKKIFEVDWVPGTAMLIRRKVIDQIGLLSTDFFMYAEDVEFCWRAKKTGWKILLFKEISVKHIGGVSSKGEVNNKTINNSIPNYYAVDSLIVGKFRASIILFLRTIAYGIESLHPSRSTEYKLTARAVFNANKQFILQLLKLRK